MRKRLVRCSIFVEIFKKNEKLGEKYTKATGERDHNLWSWKSFPYSFFFLKTMQSINCNLYVCNQLNVSRKKRIRKRKRHCGMRLGKIIFGLLRHRLNT